MTKCWWLLAWGGALAGEFDHDYSAFDKFLDGAVVESGVRYDLLQARRHLLDTHLASVAAADIGAFTESQKLALFVNAYNGYTIATILDSAPLQSIRDLDQGQVWSSRKFLVGGEQMTLDTMEHERARKLADGRVHAVVNCASRGCPPLPPDPLIAEGIDAQLDQHARRWVSHNAVEREGDKVLVSKIFQWYATDFQGWKTQPTDSDTEAALGFIRAFGGAERVADAQVVAWAPYDWSLNRVAVP